MTGGLTGDLPRVERAEDGHVQAAPEVWRVGRSVGRTIYRQVGDDPAKGDELIGVMDTPELAALVVDAVTTMETRKP